MYGCVGGAGSAVQRPQAGARVWMPRLLAMGTGAGGCGSFFPCVRRLGEERADSSGPDGADAEGSAALASGAPPAEPPVPSEVEAKRQRTGGTAHAASTTESERPQGAGGTAPEQPGRVAEGSCSDAGATLSAAGGSGLEAAGRDGGAGEGDTEAAARSQLASARYMQLYTQPEFQVG
jgi:hypothetical protein